MKLVKTILWYGAPPLPGEKERLGLRGFTVLLNHPVAEVQDALLSITLLVVLSYKDGNSAAAETGFVHLSAFVDHNIRVIVLGTTGEQALDIRKTHLQALDETYNWDNVVYIRPDLRELDVRALWDTLCRYIPDRARHRTVEVLQVSAHAVSL